jgi:hypothetical protein
MVVGHMMV